MSIRKFREEEGQVARRNPINSWIC